VPLVSYTLTAFTKVLLTKDHPTAPIRDGAYKLFVDYTMRKDQKPRNASVQIVIDFDDCVNSNCSNGTCVNGVDKYTCDCDAGYTGDFCEQNVDDCVGVVCSNGASCEVSIGSCNTCNTLVTLTPRFYNFVTPL
jgi:hypothetical protein